MSLLCIILYVLALVNLKKLFLMKVGATHVSPLQGLQEGILVRESKSFRETRIPLPEMNEAASDEEGLWELRIHRSDAVRRVGYTARREGGPDGKWRKPVKVYFAQMKISEHLL